MEKLKGFENSKKLGVNVAYLSSSSSDKEIPRKPKNIKTFPRRCGGKRNSSSDPSSKRITDAIICSDAYGFSHDLQRSYPKVICAVEGVCDDSAIVDGTAQTISFCGSYEIANRTN